MKCNIKKYGSVLLFLILVMVFTAGCGTTTDSVETDEAAVESYYLVTNVYGDGQKPWYLVIEYSTEIDPADISVDDFEIDDYDIEAIYTNSDAVIPDESASGNYVLLEISTDYTTSNYGGSGSVSGSSDDTSVETSEDSERLDSDDFDNGEFESGNSDNSDSGEKEYRSGRGSFNASDDTDENFQGGNGGNGRGSMSSMSSPSNQLTVTFKQTGSISFSNGTSLGAWDESYTTDYEDNVNLLVENFSQYTFTLSDGTDMMYSLYLPENYNENTDYPLVLFMPDATGEGSDEYLALTESLGGVIWTTEEWQSEYETIVLVPQYEDSNTEDPAYTMELVTDIVSRYSVDTSREYLVGQSSGTIRSIKLLIDYPDEFAGALLVAGQTDSAYTDSISELSTQNIWMICSEGDARAYPGMTEITEAVEAEGTEVTVAQWSAALTDEDQEQLASEQASAETTINWTVFDTGTVMRNDVTSSDATEHMNTWRVAYDLDTVREWLFEQTK